MLQDLWVEFDARSAEPRDTGIKRLDVIRRYRNASAELRPIRHSMTSKDEDSLWLGTTLCFLTVLFTIIIFSVYG